MPLLFDDQLAACALLYACLAAGVSGFPGMCAYSASKHAVVGMMRCAAAEYGPLGLRVNCINPGAIGEHVLNSDSRYLGPRPLTDRQCGTQS